MSLQYPEKRGPGRPRKYNGRQRTSLELSSNLLKYVDQDRGEESRSEYIERVLTEHFETMLAKGLESIVRDAGIAMIKKLPGDGAIEVNDEEGEAKRTRKDGE